MSFRPQLTRVGRLRQFWRAGVVNRWPNVENLPLWLRRIQSSWSQPFARQFSGNTSQPVGAHEHFHKATSTTQSDSNARSSHCCSNRTRPPFAISFSWIFQLSRRGAGKQRGLGATPRSLHCFLLHHQRAVPGHGQHVTTRRRRGVARLDDE